MHQPLEHVGAPDVDALAFHLVGPAVKVVEHEGQRLVLTRCSGLLHRILQPVRVVERRGGAVRLRCAVLLAAVDEEVGGVDVDACPVHLLVPVGHRAVSALQPFHDLLPLEAVVECRERDGLAVVLAEAWQPVHCDSGFEEAFGAVLLVARALPRLSRLVHPHQPWCKILVGLHACLSQRCVVVCEHICHMPVPPHDHRRRFLLCLRPCSSCSARQLRRFEQHHQPLVANQPPPGLCERVCVGPASHHVGHHLLLVCGQLRHRHPKQLLPPLLHLREHCLRRLRRALAHLLLLRQLQLLRARPEDELLSARGLCLRCRRALNAC
mmetsp:Transcript_32305/g.76162  ORF Transcript_32305/g.76162 Transcript_32305/m.76162 type:complete len:324 (-) Transcript_32305:314-1285(-)